MVIMEYYDVPIRRGLSRCYLIYDCHEHYLPEFDLDHSH